MEFACRVQSLLAGAEVELGSGEDGAGPPVGISDITEPFVRHHSPLVGASRRSALKWGGQLTTAGLRGGIGLGPVGAACRAAEEQRAEDAEDAQAFMR